MEKGEDYKRVKSYVEQLTPEDADLYDEIQKDGWVYKETNKEELKQGYKWHTRVVDGACVLANRRGGPTGKVGCSLHVLADRLGVHHSETKPNICWQIPLATLEEYDEATNQTTITINGTGGHVWGDTDINNKKAPGWWCVETPDAYRGGQLVYQSNETELRKLMGDLAYNTLVDRLHKIERKGGRRYPMPGEVVAGGRPLIPLMVQRRVRMWEDSGKKKDKERLERSLPFLGELVENSVVVSDGDSPENNTVEGTK